MASIKDIAKLSGVSKSTVSRVLRNEGFVKAETRSRIIQVMEEQQYRPNIFAKGMRTNKSQSIGILFPDLENPYFTQWFKVVDALAREKGYMNYICVTDPKGASEEERLDDLLAHRIDGIVFFSYRKDEALIQKLLQIHTHTPVVCCDSMFLDSGLPCVCADGEQGTFDATSYLMASGRKRLAYIKGGEAFNVVDNRYAGYLKALRANGYPLEESLVFNGAFTKTCGYRAAKQFMGLEDPPDAILAATDHMAMGVLDFLNGQGYDIPGDVAVFGHDNLPISEFSNPPLSSIALPIEDLAKRTVHLLIDLMENPGAGENQNVLECTLEIRKST